MSYKSPIDLITKQCVEQIDDNVFRAVLECEIHVDKDQLIKALAYDRGQYEKGYEDGVNSIKEWIPISWLNAQAENPSNSNEIRNAIDYIVYKLWAERKEE